MNDYPASQTEYTSTLRKSQLLLKHNCVVRTRDESCRRAPAKSLAASAITPILLPKETIRPTCFSKQALAVTPLLFANFEGQFITLPGIAPRCIVRATEFLRLEDRTSQNCLICLIVSVVVA